MHEKSAIPGDVVLLDKPFKPDRAIEIEKFLHDAGISYREWEGFWHGIILSYDGDRVCYLALYDLATGLLYLDIHAGVPVRVEFSLDEVSLFQRTNEWPSIKG